MVVLTNTTGTPTQPLISAAGGPISGKNIPFKTADLYRIADNKIAEHWNIIENVKILEPWIDQLHEPKNFPYK